MQKLGVKFATTADLVAAYPGRYDPSIPPSRWMWGRGPNGEWIGIFGNWPDYITPGIPPAQQLEPSTALLDGGEALLVIEYPDDSLENIDGWWTPEQCVEVYAGLKSTDWWNETLVDVDRLRKWCDDGESWTHADHIDDEKRKHYKRRDELPPS